MTASIEEGKTMVRAMMLGLAVALVVGFAGQAQAADGNLSSGMLADMGLSGMAVMSDAQGQEVRGMGYAAAWGSGWARVPGASSDNSYLAVGDNVAVGANISAAVNGRIRVGQEVRTIVRVGAWAVAGGASGSLSF